MSKQRELAKNTFIISLGRFATQLVSFFLLPLYTAYLSPADYGLVDLVITYVALLAPALTIQTEMAAFRFLIDARKDEAKKGQIISNASQIVVGISGFLLIAYALLSQVAHIRYGLLVLLNICAVMFANLFLQFARGLGDNRRYAIASTVTGLVTLVASLVFVANARWGAAGVLGAIIVANFAAMVYLFFAVKLYKYLRLSLGSWSLKNKLINYSLPLVPNGVSWWVINVSDRTIITLVLGLAANGIYAVSNKYAAIYTSIFMIFSLAWTESISMHIKAKDRDLFISDTSNASLKLFASIGLLLIAAVPIVFPVLIGAHFQSASKYAPILIVAGFFNAVVILYSGIYVAKKMTKQVANTSIAAAVINVVLTLAFIHWLGVYAAALATVAAYASMAVFRHYDLKKYVSLKFERLLLAKIGVAYAVVIGLFYMHTLATNILAFTVAVAVSLALNWSMLSALIPRSTRIVRRFV